MQSAVRWISSCSRDSHRIRLRLSSVSLTKWGQTQLSSLAEQRRPSIQYFRSVVCYEPKTSHRVRSIRVDQATHLQLDGSSAMRGAGWPLCTPRPVLR